MVIGIIVRLNSTVLIAEVVDKGLWTIISPRCVTADGKLVFKCLVAKHIAIVRVILAGEFRHSLQRSVETDIDTCLTFLTTLGGNQDNTISTFHTIHGCGRGVFQHGNRSHGRNIHGLDFTLDTIDEDQRLSICIPSCCTTDVNTRVLFTGLTGRSDGCNTGEVTSECRTDTTDTGCTF